MPDASRIGMLRNSDGQDGLITQAFPAKNVAADPVRNYEIAPKEIARLMEELRKRRLEFLGIYHSHPNWRERRDGASLQERLIEKLTGTDAVMG